MAIVNNVCFFISKAFYWFPSIFENPETTENFQKLIFRGIKASYLILSTLLGVLCVQDKTLKVFLKVV